MFALLLVGALQTGAPTVTTDVTRLGTAAPQAVVEVEVGKLKGEPARLAWSPDGTELYLMTAEKDRAGTVTPHHFVVSLAKKEIKGVDTEPPWASAYWLWKAGQTAPGVGTFKIDVDTRQETKRSTSSPMGGDLARGSPDVGGTGGTTMGDANSAAMNAQALTIYTLKLKGEVLGEWVNEAVTPGTTFSWAPRGSRAIVFAGKDGGLVLMDDEMRKTPVVGSKNAVLPAWSDSGTRLAWLERRDRKRFVITTADLTPKP